VTLLGVLLLLLGLFIGVKILVTIGVVLLIIGIVLLLVGTFGPGVGGRRHYW
jgi:hypothetical protein